MVQTQMKVPGLFLEIRLIRKSIIAALKIKESKARCTSTIAREEKLMADCFMGLFKVIEAAGGIVATQCILESFCSSFAIINGILPKGSNRAR